MSWDVLAKRAKALAYAKARGLQPTRTADLWFDTEKDAAWTAERLNGKKIRGASITAAVGDEDKCLVVVTGIPIEAAETELQAVLADNADDSDLLGQPPDVADMLGDVGKAKTIAACKDLVADEEEDTPHADDVQLSLLHTALKDASAVRALFKDAGLSVGFADPRPVETPRNRPVPKKALVGEVKFGKTDHVMEAVDKFDGMYFGGKYQISVQPDEGAPDGKKILVHGLPETTDWKDLKEYFGKLGPVMFAGVRRQRFSEELSSSARAAEKVKNKELVRERKLADRAPKERLVAEVEYASSEIAAKTIVKLHGSVVGKCTIFLQLELACEERTRLLVRGSNLGALTYKALTTHLSQVSPVESLVVKLVAAVALSLADDAECDGEGEETVAIKAKKRKKEQCADVESAEEESLSEERTVTTKPKKLKKKKKLEGTEGDDENCEVADFVEKRPLFSREW